MLSAILRGGNRTAGQQLPYHRSWLSAEGHVGQSVLWGFPQRVVSSPPLGTLVLKLADPPTGRDVVKGF